MDAEHLIGEAIEEFNEKHKPMYCEVSLRNIEFRSSGFTPAVVEFRGLADAGIIFRRRYRLDYLPRDLDVLEATRHASREFYVWLYGPGDSRYYQENEQNAYQDYDHIPEIYSSY